MKNKDIKEMNKKERYTYLLMLLNSYKRLMIMDIAEENKYGEQVWRRQFINALRIAKNIQLMRGQIVSYYSLLI